VERRISRDGMVSINGNAYSVPDTTTRRVVEVHALAHEIRIFEDRRLLAPGHRRWPPPGGPHNHHQASSVCLRQPGDPPLPVGVRRHWPGHGAGRGHMSALPNTPLERIRHHLVGLKMARALEALDASVRRLEEGKISALEFLDELLGEEHSTRETRRIKAQLMTARLTRIKTLEGFDFSFQPSLDRNRILALAELSFIERGAIILTSNRGFGVWGEVFGDTVVAAALLDRLLHHAIVVEIAGSSYRLREHAKLVPDNLRLPPISAPATQRRKRGRPRKKEVT
jgi:hypothetical protein